MYFFLGLFMKKFSNYLLLWNSHKTPITKLDKTTIVTLDTDDLTERSFEELSPVTSTSNTIRRKRKTCESQILTDPAFINQIKQRKMKLASKITKSDGRNKSGVCRVCKKIYKKGESWVQCLQFVVVSCEECFQPCMRGWVMTVNKQNNVRLPLPSVHLYHSGGAEGRQWANIINWKYCLMISHFFKRNYY